MCVQQLIKQRKSSQQGASPAVSAVDSPALSQPGSPALTPVRQLSKAASTDDLASPSTANAQLSLAPGASPLQPNSSAHGAAGASNSAQAQRAGSPAPSPVATTPARPLRVKPKPGVTPPPSAAAAAASVFAAPLAGTLGLADARPSAPLSAPALPSASSDTGSPVASLAPSGPLSEFGESSTRSGRPLKRAVSAAQLQQMNEDAEVAAAVESGLLSAQDVQRYGTRTPWSGAIAFTLCHLVKRLQYHCVIDEQGHLVADF